MFLVSLLIYRLVFISDKIYFVTWYAITVEIIYGFNDNILHEAPFISSFLRTQLLDYRNYYAVISCRTQ